MKNLKTAAYLLAVIFIPGVATVVLASQILKSLKKEKI